MVRAQRAVQFILKMCIQFYRLGISPGLPPRCRFQPTCSQYALEALEHHGTIRGMILMLRRILRCHPWAAGGHDPIPLDLLPLSNSSKKLVSKISVRHTVRLTSKKS